MSLGNGNMGRDLVCAQVRQYYITAFTTADPQGYAGIADLAIALLVVAGVDPAPSWTLQRISGLGGERPGFRVNTTRTSR